MADDEVPKEEVATAEAEGPKVEVAKSAAVEPKPEVSDPPAAKKAPARKPAAARKAAATKPATRGRKPAVAKPAVAKKTSPAKAVAAKAPADKVVPAKAEKPKPAAPAAKITAKPTAKPASVAKAAKPKAAPKSAPDTAPAFAGLFNNFMLEDTTMDMSANLTGFQDAMAEAQTKAKAAFEKGTAMMGEASEFTKGNVEAMMESGKIFAEGMQSMGSELVTEGRSAFETMSSDVKELAGAKSPTDFFKLQGDMMRKSFDSAVAYSSKNSEAMLKLASDAMAPISGRMSMAMEKARSFSA